MENGDGRILEQGVSHPRAKTAKFFPLLVRDIFLLRWEYLKDEFDGAGRRIKSPTKALRRIFSSAIRSVRPQSVPLLEVAALLLNILAALLKRREGLIRENNPPLQSTWMSTI
jgi:hypothetical protein